MARTRPLAPPPAYEHLRQFREEEPVSRVRLLDGGHAWVGQPPRRRANRVERPAVQRRPAASGFPRLVKGEAASRRLDEERTPDRDGRAGARVGEQARARRVHGAPVGIPSSTPTRAGTATPYECGIRRPETVRKHGRRLHADRGGGLLLPKAQCRCGLWAPMCRPLADGGFQGALPCPLLLRR